MYILCCYTVNIKTHRCNYKRILTRIVRNGIFNQTLHILGSVTLPLSYKHNLLDIELFSWEYPMIYTLQNENPFIRKASKVLTHQLGPRYEGQLMSDGGAYSPFRSILLVLTHDFIIICVYGPTGSDGHEWMVPTRTLVAHHFWPFEAKGVLYAWGPVQPANGPPT